MRGPRRAFGGWWGGAGGGGGGAGGGGGGSDGGAEVGGGRGPARADRGRADGRTGRRADGLTGRRTEVALAQGSCRTTNGGIQPPGQSACTISERIEFGPRSVPDEAEVLHESQDVRQLGEGP